MKISHIILPLLLFPLISAYGKQAGNTPKTMNKEDKVVVEVWSDVVCPFCYLGKKKLEQAIQKLGAQEKVEIRWHSFQLDPDYPKGQSVPAASHLVENRGYDPQQLQRVQQNLQNAGSAYGIDFQFEKTYTFNTFDAHRLWQWSKAYGKENEMKEALMKAYFTEGKDLSKDNALLEIATRLGMDTSAAEKILITDEYAVAVIQDQQQARALQIGGVPYFLIDGKKVISGAQDDEVFEQTLQQALNARP